jgi:hypothetical protein
MALFSTMNCDASLGDCGSSLNISGDYTMLHVSFLRLGETRIFVAKANNEVHVPHQVTLGAAGRPPSRE